MSERDSGARHPCGKISNTLKGKHPIQRLFLVLPYKKILFLGCFEHSFFSFTRNRSFCQTVPITKLFLVHSLVLYLPRDSHLKIILFDKLTFVKLMDIFSRVIFGPPVTTESRGRFESGFGYFEVFKKNWAPMPLAKVWAKPRRGQNPKWPPAAILDLLKSAILRRFYSNNTIEVSFLTNSEVKNPFQGSFFQILAIFTRNPRWPPFYQW